MSANIQAHNLKFRNELIPSLAHSGRKLGSSIMKYAAEQTRISINILHMF